IKKAMNAATTAASVGVKTPNRSPTTITIGIKSAHAASFSAVKMLFNVGLGTSSFSSFLDTKNHTTTKPTPIINPVTIPAKNSLVIETTPVTPNNINGMLGGIIGAIIPLDAIKALD